MRLPYDVRVSVKVRGQPIVKIELVRQPTGRRFWVRRDGRKSRKLAEANASQVALALTRWISGIKYDPFR